MTPCEYREDTYSFRNGGKVNTFESWTYNNLLLLLKRFVI